MKKRLPKLLVAAVLLGSLTIQADIEGWRAAITYTNGEPILSSDLQTFRLYCNTTPEEFGPPYEASMELPFIDYIPTIQELDFVHGGVPGTYWCAPTQLSTQYSTESGFGPEQNFTVTAQLLGFVPNPPW